SRISMRSGSKPRPFFNSRRGYIFTYESNLPIDYELKLCYKLRQPRSLRACSRDDPECGARRGVLRRRLVTVASLLRSAADVPDISALIPVASDVRRAGAPRGHRRAKADGEAAHTASTALPLARRVRLPWLR